MRNYQTDLVQIKRAIPKFGVLEDFSLQSFC